jgi:triacylglycerol esterase/lipase EstA (alpha/beta hydrolase family)
MRKTPSKGPSGADFLSATGRAAASVGRFVARTAVAGYRQAKAGYHKIDPDVPRHLVQLPLLSYSLFSSRRQRIDPGTPDGHPPLIFVHGLGGGRGDFLLMAQYLRLKGRKRSYRIKFQKGQTIDGMAAALARFVRDVTKATRQKKVEIVAHSLGGLVARAALVDHGLETSVRTLVTLGSPHQGTHPARYLHSKIIKDLRPESLYLRRLNRKRWPKKVRGVAFWSRSDLFILPPESATVEGMENRDATPFTHYSYLIDPLCWSQIAEILTP